MRDNGILFAILQPQKGETPIRAIELNRSDFDSLYSMFSQELWKLKTNVISFSGEYKPEFDESLEIKGFKLPEYVKEATDNPLGVDSLTIEDGEIEKLKAVFLVKQSEDEYRIFCQKFKKNQYLSQNFLKVFWDKNTVHSVNKPGINITNAVDCYYEDGSLFFKSYYIANQIFDLNEYYREATREDLEKFANLDVIAIENDVEELEEMNKWTRKKIATILDSGVLEKNNIKNILKFANELNIEFEIKNKKILFPADKQKQRNILKFLCDEIFRGNLSDNIYETNSKKLTQSS